MCLLYAFVGCILKSKTAGSQGMHSIKVYWLYHFPKVVGPVHSPHQYFPKTAATPYRPAPGDLWGHLTVLCLTLPYSKLCWAPFQNLFVVYFNSLYFKPNKGLLLFYTASSYYISLQSHHLQLYFWSLEIIFLLKWHHLVFSLAKICWWQSRLSFVGLKMPVFHSPSYLKVSVGQRTLGWQLFSFHISKISCHCLEASTVSAKKSAADVHIPPWEVIFLSSGCF